MTAAKIKELTVLQQVLFNRLQAPEIGRVIAADYKKKEVRVKSYIVGGTFESTLPFSAVKKALKESLSPRKEAEFNSNANAMEASLPAGKYYVPKK